MYDCQTAKVGKVRLFSVHKFLYLSDNAWTRVSFFISSNICDGKQRIISLTSAKMSACSSAYKVLSLIKAFKRYRCIASAITLCASMPLLLYCFPSSTAFTEPNATSPTSTKISKKPASRNCFPITASTAKQV